MSIVKEIDKLSGTTTRSHNIVHAIDKYSGSTTRSRNIEEAVKKLKKSQNETPSETPSAFSETVDGE